MTLQRTKSPDFQLFEKFTSVEANAIDQNIENALDKRSGQTDTLGSAVTCSAGGRINPRTVTGADADTTYSSQNTVIVVPNLTTTRNYTLSTTGVVTDDRITILGNTSGDITVIDGVSSTSIATVGSTGVQWIEFRYNGTNWVVLKSGPVTASVPGYAVAIARMYATQ